MQVPVWEKKNFSRFFLASMVLCILILAGGVLFQKLLGARTLSRENEVLLKIGDVVVHAEIAKDSSTWILGLSGRRSLDENDGMLFVFPDYDERTFWMKDMLFSLDIIWIADNVVVGIVENAPPPNGPEGSVAKFFSPPGVNAVLEVNAGFSKKHGINQGARLSPL